MSENELDHLAQDRGRPCSTMIASRVHERTSGPGGVGEVERDPVPAVVLRNYEQGEIHVLDETTRSVQLAPGSWTIQAASVPDGSRRSGSLEFLMQAFPGAL